MAFTMGVRPTDRVRQALEWDFAGGSYRAVTRWFELSGSRDLTGGAGNYDLAPASGEVLLVNLVHLILVDPNTGANLWSDTDFGGRTALTTGLTFTLRKNGSQVHDFTDSYKITTNQRLFALTAPNFTRVTLDEGNAMAVASWDFVGSYSPVLLDGTDDILRFNVAASDVPLSSLLRVRGDCFLRIAE